MNSAAVSTIPPELAASQAPPPASSTPHFAELLSGNASALPSPNFAKALLKADPAASIAPAKDEKPADPTTPSFALGVPLPPPATADSSDPKSAATAATSKAAPTSSAATGSNATGSGSGAAANGDESGKAAPGAALPSVAAQLNARIAVAAQGLVSQPSQALASIPHAAVATTPASAAGPAPAPAAPAHGAPPLDATAIAAKAAETAPSGIVPASTLATTANTSATATATPPSPAGDASATAVAAALSGDASQSAAGLSNPALAAAALPIPTGITPPTVSAPSLPVLAASTLDQIAFSLRQAARSGLDQIDIQLRPASLGTIDVRLQLNHDGHMAAVISADRSDTLMLLQRGSGELQQALRDAGLRTDSGSLSFNLRGDAQTNDQGARQSATLPGQITGSALDEPSLTPSLPATAIPAYAGLVNIQV